MNKAKKELKQKLVDKFNIDFTNPEFLGGDKQLFYALLCESEDDYEGSQKECKILQAENDSLKQGLSDMKSAHAYEFKQLKLSRDEQQHSKNAACKQLAILEQKLNALQKEVNQSSGTIAHLRTCNEKQMESLANIKDAQNAPRKIPFLGSETLSYQSDFILRWKEHLKEWNDLVSDFQNKYLPVSKEAINSFILRVKNVEL